MNDTNMDPDTDISGTGGVQDDFSAETDVIDEERRLHLRAFDYWHRLKEDMDYPLFSDLRADDLAPFKSNSLLLEFNKNGAVVRFIGDRVSLLAEAPISVGGYLKDFPESAFARALLDQFDDEAGRAKAAEFEFLEDHINCRGIMLPFSNDGQTPHFVMVVSNFQEIGSQIEGESEEVMPAEAVLDTDGAASERPDILPDILEELVGAGTEAAGNVAHNDRGNRLSLYNALARALAIHEEALTDPEAYEALLSKNGLRAQKRAPYTPVLKMVFGKGYDKTRLTEYAAALSFAVRSGKNSSNLEEFLSGMPGGIKGCVQQERALKRTQAGTPEYNRHQEAIKKLREAEAVSSADIKTDKEFYLILARQNEDGSVDMLGEADVGRTALDAAIRNLANADKE